MRRPIEPGDPRYRAVYHDPDLVLRTFALGKTYGGGGGGGRPALTDVELEVRRGDLFGLLGANGAGKTTLLRIAATLLEPTHGSIYVAGSSARIWPDAVRRSIGYMPDSAGVQERVAVHAYLEFFALLLRIPRAERAARVAAALEEVGLAEKRRAEIPTLSRGMQQRLALARLLLREPPVLLLDEPLSGLDPRGRIEILELLRGLHRAGRTVVISSHVLHDLEPFCNRLAILEAGRMKFCGGLAAARTAAAPNGRWVVAVRGRAAEAAAVLRSIPDVADVAASAPDAWGGNGAPAADGPGRIAFRLPAPAADPGAALARLVADGFALIEVGREQASLEDVFFHFTEGRVA
ncbi:MAG: ABC transporter ATP-binding protein [Planctomycetes bacterium]|nr:ABC transporter ATP-binding protein [Planctomycetota bacterium]